MASSPPLAFSRLIMSVHLVNDDLARVLGQKRIDRQRGAIRTDEQVESQVLLRGVGPGAACTARPCPAGSWPQTCFVRIQILGETDFAHLATSPAAFVPHQSGFRSLPRRQVSRRHLSPLAIKPAHVRRPCFSHAQIRRERYSYRTFPLPSFMHVLEGRATRPAPPGRLRLLLSGPLWRHCTPHPG